MKYQLVVSINKQDDLALIISLLERLGAEVMGDIDAAQKQVDTREFYQRFSYPISADTYDRDEANER